MPRGSAKTEDDVGDDVFVVYGGECQLVLVKRVAVDPLTKKPPSGKGSTKAGLDHATPVAMVGRFYAFSRTDRPTPDPSIGS